MLGRHRIAKKLLCKRGFGINTQRSTFIRLMNSLQSGLLFVILNLILTYVLIQNMSLGFFRVIQQELYGNRAMQPL